MSVGILKNGPNIFDAHPHSGVGTLLVTGDQYNNGTAVKAFDPGIVMMDTGIIPAGTFGGTYSIGFYYDSTTATVQGTPLMRFEMYEDGVLMPEDTSEYVNGTLYSYDLNYVEHVHTYGLFQNFTLDASKTHQLIIKTASGLVDDAILDYIIFEKVASNDIVNGIPVVISIGCRNGGDTRDISTHGTQLVYEWIHGCLAGTLTPGGHVNYGYRYNTPFKTVIGVAPTIIDSYGQLISDWSDWTPETSQVKIYIKNISSSNWNKAVNDESAWNYTNVRILISGYI